ncbi:hypothetical protein PFISCL1PPCAC_21908, partial [Pristionchus fissidentatus]
RLRVSRSRVKSWFGRQGEQTEDSVTKASERANERDSGKLRIVATEPRYTINVKQFVKLVVDMGENIAQAYLGDSVKKVNEPSGVKESDIGLAPPALWYITADKQAMQPELPLQAARCTKII